MPSSTLRRDWSESTPRIAALWFGLLAGPLAWAAVLETNYVLSYVACEQRSAWMLHLATLLGVLMCGSAGYAAWRAMPASGDESQPSIDFDATTHLVERFIGIAGMTVSAWFVVTILAMEVPILTLGPCQ